jgi:hypothetical protein
MFLFTHYSLQPTLKIVSEYNSVSPKILDTLSLWSFILDGWKIQVNTKILDNFIAYTLHLELCSTKVVHIYMGKSLALQNQNNIPVS